MAVGKKSFILYADLIHVVRKLVDNDRANNTNNSGELFLQVLEYVNDTDPVAKNFIIDMAFEPIKLQLKRDLVAWDETVGSKSDAGILGNLKRWNKDLYDKVVKGSIQLSEASQIAQRRRASHRVAKIAVTDNVTVTYNVTDINKEKEILSSQAWIEGTAMLLKVKKPWVENHLKDFLTEQKLKNAFSTRTIDDLRNHFINVAKKLDKSSEQPKAKIKW